jgi:hypothetical protein
MYSHDSRQFGFSEYLLPFEGKLEANNRLGSACRYRPLAEFREAIRDSVFSRQRLSRKTIPHSFWSINPQGTAKLIGRRAYRTDP